MNYNRLIPFLLLVLLGPGLFAQDDLMDLLEGMEEETTDYTYATFKTVRIMNAHSIEMSAPGVMTMIISHRFGRVNGGAYEFFGLDQANLRLGFEYGITPWLNIGIGRTNIQKTYDGFLKAKLLRQSTGKRTMPISVAWLSSTQVNTLEWADPDRENLASSRLSYVHQLMIGRKFSDRLSLQLMPTMVHRNLVPTNEEENDVFSIGAGGRVKLLPSLTLNVEYFYTMPGFVADNYQDVLSIGIDIETGGHVFQLIFSNAVAMTENLYLTRTDGDWGAGDIHFGFNLTRVFNAGKKGSWAKSKKK
ncbi:MAG: DUF5777 family beta-barrel protein [Bacteroidota bacterium]